MEGAHACLTSVAVVSRDIEGISGVERLVSDFLDASVMWTMPRACSKSSSGVVRLLRRIAAREDPDMDPLLKRWNFTMCLEKAVKKGDLEAVKWLVEEYLPEERIRKPVLIAVRYSRLEILQWLHANHNERVVWDPSMRMQDGLKRCTNLETLQWVHGNVVPIDHEAKDMLMKAAVRWQLVDRVDWLHSLDLPFVQPDLNLATLIGDIPMVEWIRDHTDAQFTEELLDAALRSRNIGLVQWFYNHCGFSTASASVIAIGIMRVINNAGRGDTQIVDEFITWVLEHLTLTNKESLARAIDFVASLGSLQVIQTIHKISGAGLCSTAAMDSAARNGRLELVKWLHKNRSEGCTPVAMDGAAGNGHLEVVKFLHEHRNEGCTSAAMDGAAENGHHRIVKWLHTNRSEGCTPQAMDLAAANGHLAIVEFLHENRTEGCTTNAMDWAAGNGHLEVVKWLHENRSEGCTFEAMNKAAANGHLETVKLLYDNRGEGCRDSALHYATNNRQHEVARWLYRRKINDESWLKDSNDGKFNYLIRVLNWDDKIATEGADGAISWAINWVHTKAEVSWLLQQLPDHEFSSDSMVSAIGSNKLDIAMLLAKDGRFACDIRCFQHAHRLMHVELFQWLVRDFSDSVIEANELIQQTVIDSQFMRDALNELEELTASI